MSRTHTQVNFRIPPELHDQLRKAAADSNRSVTAELVSRLEASFAGEGPTALASQRLARVFMLRSLVNEAKAQLKDLEASPRPSDLERVEIAHHRAALGQLRHLYAEALADFTNSDELPPAPKE